MSKRLKNRNQGFTIIEVMIVLAIAGLIMLIVFLAVPALQRNQRNTSRRNEASRILGAYSEISNTKNGAVLAGADEITVHDHANAKDITTLNIAAHSATNITVNATAGDNTVNLNAALIRTGAKCAAPDSGTATAGSSRQIALYFVVETSNSTQIQCQDS